MCATFIYNSLKHSELFKKILESLHVVTCPAWICLIWLLPFLFQKDGLLTSRGQNEKKGTKKHAAHL